MKKAISILSIILVATLFVGCNDRETYSQLQVKEANKIKEFIAKNNINVVTEFPKVWDANTYYKTSSDLYIHIDAVGDTATSISPKGKTKVHIRTLEFNLDDQKTPLSDKMSPSDYPSPLKINYGNPSANANIATGIYEAIGYMKNLNSKATIIVPSYLNTSDYGNTLTPVGYKIWITVINDKFL